MRFCLSASGWGREVARLFLGVLSILTATHLCAAQTYTSFSPPSGPPPVWGAVLGGQNASGTATGYWENANFDTFGFTVTASGVTTTLTVPGSVETYPTSISKAGWVAGVYQDAITFVNHGFLRNAAGTYVKLTAPNSRGKSRHDGMQAAYANDSNTVSGAYFGTDNYEHGFVRSAAAAYTVFDVVPNSYVADAFLNNAGMIAGRYQLALTGTGSGSHGFIRSTTGVITTFDVPGATGTYPRKINASGEVAGYWNDAAVVAHGFLRDAAGNVTTFDVPGALAASVLFINGLADDGVIYGTASNATGTFSWRRAADGSFTFPQDPLSVGGSGYTAYGTVSGSDGYAAGYYFDPSSNLKGFVVKLN